ncbi:MAG: hypothetical protein MJZ11_08550 [Lachnospiraceae bacterium]|nr:hypothetical protein [Lachnospiraceae bacterium]
MSEEVILSRVNFCSSCSLEEENARLSNSVIELTNSKTELENKVTELEKQIKKIKNCKNLNLKHSKCDKRLKIAINVKKKTDDYKFIGKTSPMDYIPLNSFYTERHDS